MGEIGEQTGKLYYSMGQTWSMGGQKLPWQNTDSFLGVRDFPKAVLSEAEV